MIKCIYRGRLGNNLFQYALARILAVDLGYSLEVRAIEGFPATRDRVKGIVVGPRTEELVGQTLDIDRIYQNKGKVGYKLSGWFQQYSYYKRHRDRIRSWFNRTRGKPLYDLTPEDIVVHVRRTQKNGRDQTYPYEVRANDILCANSVLTLDDTVRDHLEFHNVNRVGRLLASTDLISFEWYESILDTLSFSKLYICTDVPDDPFLRYFDKYNPIISQAGEWGDFVLLRSANRIVCCHSTFSWWAAWLSDASEVYLPVIHDSGTWSCQDVDLVVDDLPHYNLVDYYRSGRLF